jgi:hypothetical protein
MNQIINGIYSRACQGNPGVVAVIGNAGIGKSHALTSWLHQHTAAAQVATCCTLSPWDTPQSITRYLLMQWHQQLIALYEGHQASLEAHAKQLGLPMTTIQDWLGTLTTREERLIHIKQQLPWLKKMTPSVKGQVDSLLDLMGTPWLAIAQQHSDRVNADLSDKAPTELVHMLVDEWLSLHRKLPATGVETCWSIWLDGIDNLIQEGETTPNAMWQQWLNTLINAVSTAEQLRAMVVLTCRSEQLGQWLSPTFHRVTPLLLGPLSVSETRSMLASSIGGVEFEPTIWERFYAITQGNPAWTHLLGLGLTQRRALLADGLTEARLNTLGLVSTQALLDWWLVPLQLTPGIEVLPPGSPHQLLMLVSRQGQWFTPEQILTLMASEGPFGENPPQRVIQAAFAFLQQLFHLQLIQAEDTMPGVYKVFNRCVIEALARRFPSPAVANAAEHVQKTLAQVLEVSLLSGKLDQQQLSDLWQWCQSSEDPAMLKTMWLSLAERAVMSPHQRIVLSGLAALQVIGELAFSHIQPYLEHQTLDAYAWRLACDMAWPEQLPPSPRSAQELINESSAESSAEATDSSNQAVTASAQSDNSALVAFYVNWLGKGINSHKPAVRACALVCVQHHHAMLPAEQLQDWLIKCLEDAAPMVCKQAIKMSMVVNPEEVNIPTGNLMRMAKQSDPGLLATLLPLIQERLTPEALTPMALEQWNSHMTKPAVQTQWLNVLRQITLNPEAETQMLQALQHATSPDLIWVLHQKLSRDGQMADTHHQLQDLSNRAASLGWPEWLQQALKNQHNEAAEELTTVRAKSLPLLIGPQ